MLDTTVTQPGWEITEHTSDDGTRHLRARVGDFPEWAAVELMCPVGGYRWQVFHVLNDEMPHAIVWDEAAARAWLEHEAAHALLAAKVVAS